MFAEVKDATRSSPKILVKKIISSKDWGRMKLYVKIVKSKDHYSVQDRD